MNVQAQNIQGSGIKFYREKLKAQGKQHSQQALAEHVGCPRSEISMMESGRITPTPDQIEKMCEFLECNPGQLYSPKQIELIYDLAGIKRK